MWATWKFLEWKIKTNGIPLISLSLKLRLLRKCPLLDFLVQGSFNHLIHVLNNHWTRKHWFKVCATWLKEDIRYHISYLVAVDVPLSRQIRKQQIAKWQFYSTLIARFNCALLLPLVEFPCFSKTFTRN